MAASSFEEYDFEHETKKMLTKAIPYTSSDDEEEIRAKKLERAFVIDTSEWYRGDNPRLHPFHSNGNLYI
jgi:hypothetical protein